MVGLVTTPAASSATETESLGDVTSFVRDRDNYAVKSGESALRVSLNDADLLRAEVAPDGTFTDPANHDPADPDAPDADIVVKGNYPGGDSAMAN